MCVCVCETLGVTGNQWIAYCLLLAVNLAGECGMIVDRTQHSYHNHGIPGLINSAYLQCLPDNLRVGPCFS